jgi:hypothetical protein
MPCSAKQKTMLDQRPHARAISLVSGTILSVSAFSIAHSSQADPGPSIEQLLKDDWEIAGYSQAFDNRSTFILFRKAGEQYLVQCRVGYDVTRTPPTYSICYKLQ